MDKTISFHLSDTGLSARLYDHTGHEADQTVTAPTFADLIHKLDAEVLEPATRFETEA